MKPLDNYFLLLQFKIKIHEKNGNEFQSFFENIMEKAFIDFQTIRPLGNKGDKGNDGYRKKSGIYYQVYSPITPKVNETKASNKLEIDFKKLQNEWEDISKIKEYNFVFNDKYHGSVQLLEGTITKLKENNPNIEFKLFLAKDLENVFNKLSEADKLGLGFNVDHRQAIKNAYIYLEKVKVELDREIANIAQKLLENINGIIIELADDDLSYEYEILECRCLQKTERIVEAKNKYENIIKRFPKDPIPLLYLAEISLNEKDFVRNQKLLERAKNIDENNSFLILGQLLRKLHLGEFIDTKNIDEKTFTEDPKIKANFYRMYGWHFEDLGDQIKADSYIEKAIYFNPDQFSNYIAKLTLIEKRLVKCQDASQRVQLSQILQDEIKIIENKFIEKGEIRARNKAILNSKKLNAFLAQENIQDFVNVSENTFKLLFSCYFDVQIELILLQILQFVTMPIIVFRNLQEFCKNSRMRLSDDLYKVLVFQFDINNSLFTDGKVFFEEINNNIYVKLIHDLENNNYKEVLSFLEQDIYFTGLLTNTLKNHATLRKKIFKNLLDHEDYQKLKLTLLLNSDEIDYEQTFQIIKQLDLSTFNYFECRSILQIIQKMEAWEDEIIILEKLFDKERNERGKFNLKLQLFIAFQNLKNFQEVINIGEQLLLDDSEKNYLNPSNKEALLSNTISACFERGKIDKQAFEKSKTLLEKYSLITPSFEFKVDIETEVFLKNNEVGNALTALIDGVKIKKLLSSQEYARMYILFVEIGNQYDLDQISLDNVQENTFVKLKNKIQWYFIGNGNELDALLINETNNKYSSFINKKIGDEIIFENKYYPEKKGEEIEIIYPIEKYVFWQVVKNFLYLSSDGDLDGVEVIKIPQNGDAIDLRNLNRKLEDIHKDTEPLFEKYCQNKVPLAMLAVSEGSLINAIGRIQQENKGYINFSIGTFDELEKQKEIARIIIDEKMPFYIDGTSAMFLSEMGLFQKIHTYLPNIKVPQSVLNYLADIIDKFRYMPGLKGYLGYVQGKITFSPFYNDSKYIQSNFIECIKIFESNPGNIRNISPASKMDCFSERMILNELSDACILAKKENLPIMTEDFLYLQMNELETNKKAPEYFSSWALLRILYENKIIRFNEYLDYFYYLSFYRFRFLSINSDDIEKAVFGEGDIKIINPKNIKKLNFPFTLSEEYGVSFQEAFKVVVGFFQRVLLDNSVTIEIAENIFIEIVGSFPTKIRKKDFGQMLLRVCSELIKNDTSLIILRPKNQLIQQKIDKLIQATGIFNFDSKLRLLN